MSLLFHSLKEGQLAKIASIQGDKSLSKKMLGLGIRKGAEVSMVQKRRQGYVLASKGTRVALSESMAACLLVDLLA